MSIRPGIVRETSWWVPGFMGILFLAVAVHALLMLLAESGVRQGTYSWHALYEIIQFLAAMAACLYFLLAAYRQLKVSRQMRRVDLEVPDSVEVGQTFSVKTRVLFSRPTLLETLKVQLSFREEVALSLTAETRPPFLAGKPGADKAMKSSTDPLKSERNETMHETMVAEEELHGLRCGAGEEVESTFSLRIPPGGMHTFKESELTFFRGLIDNPVFRLRWFVILSIKPESLPVTVKMHELLVLPTVAGE